MTTRTAPSLSLKIRAARSPDDARAARDAGPSTAVADRLTAIGIDVATAQPAASNDYRPRAVPSAAGSVGVAAVGDVEDGDGVGFVVDAVDDPVGPAASAVPVVERGA